MTAASSIAFSTMEVPVLDDTMEMASPYQGHVDDFDIDLDVMEDQVSNPDKDMMGADDYPENTHETEFDADMIDDVAEPTMVDADDQYPETSNSVEMQYSEKIYEAEMAEDDFDEDIDAHVSDFQEKAEHDIPAVHVNDQEIPEAQHTQEVQEVQEVQEEQKIPEVTEHVEATNVAADENNDAPAETQIEASAENDVAPDHDQQEDPQPQHENRSEENVEQERGTDHPERILDTEKSIPGTNETEQVEHQEIDPATRDNSDTTPKQAQDEGEEHAHDEAQPSADEPQHAEEKVEDKETLDNHEDVGHETDTLEHASALYPVKVYYQDNEISLFPPREGDSSETFFLEDENLAYEPFGKLLESCREVLCEHIADTELLVMDIESLNLQLTEGSSHISKVTLYQLVDLYLRLCHNDGADEPEPLYLTLSTKLTIAAEVSDLLAAADEGKGLSEVLPWDGYQEAGEFSPENWEEDDQEEAQEEPPQETVVSENGHQLETHDTLNDNSGGPVPDALQADNDQQQGLEESDPVSDNNGLNNASAENITEPTGAEEIDDQGAASREADHVESHDNGSPDEGAYDSEEQKTESTATIAPLLGVDSVNEQQYADQSTNISPDDQTARDAQPDHDTPNGDDDREDPLQDETDQEPVQSVGFHEANGNGDEAAELDVEEDHEDLPEENPESLHSEDEVVAVTTNDPGNDTEATLQGDDGGLALEGAESSLENVPSEQLESQAQPSAGAPDVASGVTEELPKSSAQDFALDQGIEQADLSEEIQDEAEQVPSLDPSKDEPLEFTFDDDDDEYLDLGLADEFNFDDEEPAPDSTGLASSKRPREPEDEIELAESPTPDAKRSRSS